MQRQLFKNSFIYTAAAFIQKGIIFFLLPLYLNYLTETEFGAIALIQSVATILTVFFTLGLDAAILRFFYDRASEKDFNYLFGTLLVAILGMSIISYTASITIFAPVLKLLLTNVRFYPDVYVGLAILMFQPVYNLCLSYLQAKGDAQKYVVLNLLYFLINICLAILFIIFFEWGTVGYLLAILIAQFIAAGTGMIMIRHDYILSFRFALLRKAIGYSTQFIPHMLFGQITSYADRIVLNRNFNQAKVGVYQLGYLMCLPLDILSSSINRAFSPFYFKNVEGSDEAKQWIIDSAYLITIIYFTGVGFLSFFSLEILDFFFEPGFSDAMAVVPLIGFAFVNNGFYYLLSYPLFYDKKLTRYLPLCTVTSGVAVVVLDLVLIPRLGLIGAGIAMYCGQALSAILVYYFARPFTLLKWPVRKFFFAYALTFVITGLVVFTNNNMFISWWYICLKAVVLIIVFVACVFIYFGSVINFYNKLVFLRQLNKTT